MKMTRDHIVKTASSIADKEGLNKVTLKRVAEELGIRSPSLYNHISSLDDLWREMAHHGMKSMTCGMKEAVIGKFGGAAIKIMGRSYLSYMILHPGIYEAIQWAVWHGNQETAERFNEYEEFLRKLVLSLELKNGETDEIVKLLEGVLHGYSTMQLGESLKNPDKCILSLMNCLDIVLLGIQEAYKVE